MAQTMPLTVLLGSKLLKMYEKRNDSEDEAARQQLLKDEAWLSQI